MMTSEAKRGDELPWSRTGPNKPNTHTEYAALRGSHSYNTVERYHDGKSKQTTRWREYRNTMTTATVVEQGQVGLHFANSRLDLCMCVFGILI